MKGFLQPFHVKDVDDISKNALKLVHKDPLTYVKTCEIVEVKPTTDEECSRG